MQLHELKPKHKEKRKKRIGRGGKRGTFSGKGVKGQKSRAGRKMPPVIREIIKRYPKLRNYRFSGIPKNVVVLNLDIIEKSFEAGATITPDVLLLKQIIRRINGKTPKVKILGNGKLTKSLTIENCQVSKTAKEAIEKAGGTIK